ncbi:unnamed protein product [Euphydryas editha]|uniref:Retrotransposon gag domain-containing protein n=1 Tax=Euphydryas editha TaxID=104508 RepID=A0AAU9TG07_EUPED|nr:unnamed protein product [Euphydryas editha]
MLNNDNENNQDHSEDPLGAPSSEVGYTGTSQEHAGQSFNDITDNNRWKILFEAQQRQMFELIRALKQPSNTDLKVTFPEYNPDAQDNDARAWCNTVDLCMQENPLSGGSLIIAMSKALKGSAASWLAQNSFAGITWSQLKDLFLARFDYVETPAATLYRLLNGTPKEGECMSSYATRFLSTLMSQWRSLSVEQIAIAVTIAHASRIDTRLQRLAFTTEINTRVKLQQELMALTYRKRGPQTSDKGGLPCDAKKTSVRPSKAML